MIPICLLSSTLWTEQWLIPQIPVNLNSDTIQIVDEWKVNGVQNVVLHYLYTNNWNRILTDETEGFQLWRGNFLLFFFADLKNSAGKTDDKFI